MLVTGASGFIGSFLCEEGLKHGCTVWAGMRRRSSRRYLQNEWLQFVELDMTDKSVLKAQLTDFKNKYGAWDVVIHAAGATKCLKREDFELNNYVCTRNLADALVELDMVPKQFIFVNTHLDHQGAAARENGIRLIMERIKEINRKSLPVVLVGDFNAAVSDPALSAMSDSMKNARRIAAETDAVGTFHDWGKASSMIDHIFYSGFRSCTLFETVTDSYSGRRFISDHYPVKAVLVF